MIMNMMLNGNHAALLPTQARNSSAVELVITLL